MLNQDWDRFGEEIRRTVQNAVDSQDFVKLNQTITNTVNKTLDSARNLTTPPVRQQPTKIRPLLFKRVTGWKAGALSMLILGIPVSVTSLGLLAGALFFVDFTSGFMALSSAIILGIFSVMLASGVALSVAGAKVLGKLKRFGIYIEELGMNEYFQIDTVSERMNKSKKYIIRDLKKMISKKWFLQGHIDKQNTCFIASDDMFQQYNEMMLRVEEQKAIEQAEQNAKEEAQKKQEGLEPEVRDIIQAGEEYIRKIRECNDRIPGEEISNKISRIEMLVDKIFDRVEEEPGCKGEIRKLMDYYLPTTVKLLEAYAELDEMPVQGDNIISSKNEIEKTLDTLNVAFTKLLDSLFQEKVWDVSADISVLNTMLAQEGLTKKDF